LTYDEFVHVNTKALSQSRVTMLIRKGKSHKTFADSASKRGIA
jgi:hypothetical protein